MEQLRSARSHAVSAPPVSLQTAGSSALPSFGFGGKAGTALNPMLHYAKRIAIASTPGVSASRHEVDPGRDVYLWFALDNNYSYNGTNNNGSVFGGDSLSSAGGEEILYVSVKCLSHNHTDSKVTSEHASLQIALIGPSSEVIWNKVYYCNGEYTLTVPLASVGLIKGVQYSLKIQNTGDYHLNHLGASTASSHFYRGHNPSFSSSQPLIPQRIFVDASVVRDCQAEPLRSNEIVHGSVAIGSYRYYKFPVGDEDASKLIRISAKALNSGSDSNIYNSNSSSSSSSGLDPSYMDIDICVSNRSGGLVLTNMDSESGYIWKSCNRRSAEQIEIHPLDIQRGSGGVFVIGVLGCHQALGNTTYYEGGNNNNDQINYELSVCLVDAPSIAYVDPPTDSRPIILSTQCKSMSYSYFAISVNDIKSRRSQNNNNNNTNSNNVNINSRPTFPDRIVIKVSDNSYRKSLNTEDIEPDKYSYDHHALITHGIPKDTYGRGIYCCDLFENVSYSKPQTSIDTADNTSDRVVAPSVIPVVYISTTAVYPSHSNFMWRASPSIHHSMKYGLHTGFFIELDEVLELVSMSLSVSGSSSCNYVYFSVYGHQLNYDSNFNNNTNNNGSTSANTSFNNTSFQESFDESFNSKSRRFPLLSKSFTISIWSHNTREIVNSEFQSSKNESDTSVAIFNRLFKGVDGFKLAIDDRLQSKFTESTSLTYGEIELQPFRNLMNHLGQLALNPVFCDIGSGIGKAIAAAALSEVKFYKCIGIERCPRLVEGSNAVIAELKRLMATANSFMNCPQLEIVLGDASQMRWNEADVVFFSSYCFDDELLRSLFLTALKMKIGSKIITFKRPAYLTSDDDGSLFDSHFAVFDKRPLKCSWGISTVIILERRDAMAN